MRSGKNRWISGTSTISRHWIPTKEESARSAPWTKPDQEKPTTWCFAIIGQRARQISRQTALRIIRSRWHIEDTGFHQWISYWHLGHVFRHGENPLQVILLIWTLAFNLLQLFIYRRLGRCRRPKDPTDTIRHIVEVMLREVALLP